MNETATSWFSKIDRKVWSGGVGGLLSLGIMAVCNSWFHFDLAGFLQPLIDAIFLAAQVSPAPSAQGALAILFGGFVGYVVPAAYKDIYNKINNRIVALAVTDKDTPVSIEGVKQETAKINPGTTGLY